MNVSELNYTYPDHLIALQPNDNYRTLLVETNPAEPNLAEPNLAEPNLAEPNLAEPNLAEPNLAEPNLAEPSLVGPKPKYTEISKAELFNKIQPGDVVVINDTQVLYRRVFTPGGLEILFLNSLTSLQWEVLFPARGLKIGDSVELPGSVHFKLSQKGLPQTITLSQPLDEDYFFKYGELALPPYIQKARGQRHMQPQDPQWYQTAWARVEGSCAAPTASLHFTQGDLDLLQEKKVQVRPLTLHVGLGTFLPIKTEDLKDHTMHSEGVEIPRDTILAIQNAKKDGNRVWALGTTVTRSLEAWKQNHFLENSHGDWVGETNLFITPGFDFQIVDAVMTNFHQPKSTLLALVCAFAGTAQVLEAYEWAIQNHFRLFSYGDFSVWINNKKK